jgi:hypothetical protein
MTAMKLPKPEVRLVENATLSGEGVLALYALDRLSVSGKALSKGDLVLTTGPAQVEGGAALAIRLSGLTPDNLKLFDEKF